MYMILSMSLYQNSKHTLKTSPIETKISSIIATEVGYPD